MPQSLVDRVPFHCVDNLVEVHLDVAGHGDDPARTQCSLRLGQPMLDIQPVDARDEHDGVHRVTRKRQSIAVDVVADEVDIRIRSLVLFTGQCDCRFAHVDAGDLCVGERVVQLKVYE